MPNYSKTYKMLKSAGMPKYKAKKLLNNLKFALRGPQTGHGDVTYHFVTTNHYTVTKKYKQKLK